MFICTDIGTWVYLCIICMHIDMCGKLFFLSFRVDLKVIWKFPHLRSKNEICVKFYVLSGTMLCRSQYYSHYILSNHETFELRKMSYLLNSAEKNQPKYMEATKFPISKFFSIVTWLKNVCHGERSDIN